MFHEEFYPTPWRVAVKMLSNIFIDYRDSVLEPSAGKGDLLDVILKKVLQRYPRSRDDLDIDCLEINPELRLILKGKGHRVVGFDFLRFDTFKRYDWIFTNPPFSNGDAHLTKALDLLKPGGTCICILNAETIDNPYTNQRQALLRKLESWNADISTRLEKAFKGADVVRQSDVRIALIRVTRPLKTESPSIVLDGLKRDFLEIEEESELIGTSIVHHDFIKQIVSRFKFEAMAGMRMFDVWEELKPHMTCRFPPPDSENVSREKSIIEMPMSRNAYLRILRSKYWEALFQNPNFISQLTSNLRSELVDSIERMKDYDFSEENISALQLEILSKTTVGIESTIMELFDELARDYRWYPECKTNKHYFDGWATNFSECCKINNKVILPLHNIEKNSWSSSISFRNLGRLNDMELCLDYLDSSKRDYGGTTAELLEQASCSQNTSKIQLRHFEVTFYKKGTTHIKFHDPELVQKLNIFACRGKRWLPPSYGKKQYEDLTPEEKRAIDSFEGEESYREVCQRPDLLISTDSLVPLLSSPE